MKILVFGASNSSTSINKRFATFTSQFYDDHDISIIDLNDFEMPLFKTDRENIDGIPQKAHDFLDLIKSHDALIISLAEHNSNLTVAFKNIFDWTSRIDGKVFQEKPILLLSASPGSRGGANAMGIALKFWPFSGGHITAHFSLPSFYQNFDDAEGITDSQLRKVYLKEVQIFKDHLESLHQEDIN